jgi:hypothetical protein
MSSGWETSIDDVQIVLKKMGKLASEDDLRRIHNSLDMFLIESAALYGHDMEEQTEHAYQEIESQINSKQLL